MGGGRTPPGLTVTDAGLWGVRGSARVALSWIDLAGVSVVDAKGAKLVLQPRAAAPIVVEPRWTGSDPNLVAAIVGHYLASPADRPLLAHPRDAVRRVETTRG